MEFKKIILFGVIFVLIFICLGGCTDEESDDTIKNNDDNDDTNDDNDKTKFNFDENWDTVTIDDDGWVGIDPMIAVDGENNPHIAYYDQGRHDLKYAYFNGEKWNTEIVDSEGDVGEEPGIDIDSKGTPHISYKDHTNSALCYAYKNNDEWTVTTIDSLDIEIEAMSTSLKIDSDDNIHIAYSFGLKDSESYNGYVFRYAYYDGEDWNIENVRKAGSDVIIDVDSYNTPHISFKGDMGGDDRIMYAKKVKGNWEVEVVDDTVEADGDTGLAVHSDGTPHIIYHDYQNGLIKYATKIDTTWTILKVADNQNNQEGIKIDVDEENVPHLVYSDIPKDSMDGYMVYAKRQESVWVKENVYIMDNPAIAVDSVGNVHIAHNMCADGNPKDYDPNYSGDETEIEILKYSKRT